MLFCVFDKELSSHWHSEVDTCLFQVCNPVEVQTDSWLSSPVLWSVGAGPLPPVPQGSRSTGIRKSYFLRFARCCSSTWSSFVVFPLHSSLHAATRMILSRTRLHVLKLLLAPCCPQSKIHSPLHGIKILLTWLTSKIMSSLEPSPASLDEITPSLRPHSPSLCGTFPRPCS